MGSEFKFKSSPSENHALHFNFTVYWENINECRQMIALDKNGEDVL